MLISNMCRPKPVAPLREGSLHRLADAERCLTMLVPRPLSWRSSPVEGELLLYP